VAESKESRKAKLWFALKFAYGVPDEILDRIDLEAYADPTLTTRENMEVLLERYPVLRRYVYDIDVIVSRAEEAWRQFLQDILTHFENAIAGYEEDIKYLDEIGFDFRDEQTVRSFLETLVMDDVISSETAEELYERWANAREASMEREEDVLEKIMLEEAERRAEEAERRAEEAEKRAEEAEKRAREVERRLDRLTRLLESATVEKLTWFVRSKLLERGLSVAEMRRIADAMSFDIAQLAKDVVEGRLTQTEAESKLLSEIERRIREMPMSKAEAMKKLEEEYLTYLREQGVTNVRQVLEAVREDIEALAEEVAAGRLTLEEALQRVREIPMPPIARLRKVVAPPVAPPPEEVPPEVPPEVPEAFLTPKEAADIIWNEYLPDLFNFGLGYVFENYMRRRGMTAGMRSRVAEILASYLRTLGLEMERRGKEEEKGRLMWAGEALVKYAPEIVWFGILRPFARYAAELWPTLRYFPNIVKALQATGIENCIAKALVGVVYDYLKIPYEAWPSDVFKCYQTLQDVAGVDP
jgi:hypothetical protein